MSKHKSTKYEQVDNSGLGRNQVNMHHSFRFQHAEKIEYTGTQMTLVLIVKGHLLEG